MRILAPIVGLILILSGISTLFTYFTNQEPTAVHVGDLTSKPTAEWIAFSGSQMDLAESVFFHHKRDSLQAKELFAPLRSPEQDGLIVAFARYKSGELFDTYNKLNGAADTEEMLKHYDHLETLYDSEHTTILGMINSSISAGDHKYKELTKKFNDLAPDFFIIDADRKPSMSGIGNILVGLLILLFVFRKRLFKKK